VGRDEERAVLRIDPEAVDVDRPRILDLRRLRVRIAPSGVGVIVTATTREEHE
jgi:hypothetical protein